MHYPLAKQGPPRRTKAREGKRNTPPPTRTAFSARLQGGGTFFHQTNAGCPIPPDFLRGVAGSTHCMRLSLMKAAHAAPAGAAYRKSGYLARFSRDVGFREPLPWILRFYPTSTETTALPFVILTEVFMGLGPPKVMKMC
jgi:hypothetical protein